MFITQKIIIKMEAVEQINIKNRTYYFYNDIIDLEHFTSNLLKIDKKSYKKIDIYNIGHVTIKKIDDCENINSVNTFVFTYHPCTRIYIGEINGKKIFILRLYR